MLFLYIFGCQQDNMQSKQNIQPIEQVDHWCDAALGSQKSTLPWQQDLARAPPRPRRAPSARKVRCLV